MTKPVHKSQKELTAEWDALACVRSEQIASGLDLSFANILVPTILSLSALTEETTVVDVGCGTGFLLKSLSIKGSPITAVDSSSKSIEIAQKNCASQTNISFVEADFSQFAHQTEYRFDLAVANMTLMTVLSLQDTLRAIAKVLKPEGVFAFTIIHPCFWPLYKNYLQESWFSYWDDVQVEAPFSISLKKDESLLTTHIHRPLQHYFSELISSGFTITQLLEPQPSPELHSRYPEPWLYPRFLAIQCVRRST